MKALVIAHDHLSGTGLLAAALDDAGIDPTTLLVVSADRFATPDVAVDFPSARGFDLVVSLGAPWSVYDEARLGAWVGGEQQLLRDADGAGVPVLGICFGGQQLAAAHGGSVTRAERPEIGWLDVDTDDAGLVESGPWFEWHYDAWQTPPGAREFARTATAVQAFTLRRNLAVQFHPEANEKIVLGWLDNGGAGQAREHGVDPDELLAATVAAEPAAAERAARLLSRFLEQVASA